MELNYNNFDGDSKKIIKELTKESSKFENLIYKLQTARSSIDSKLKIKTSLKEDVKK